MEMTIAMAASTVNVKTMQIAPDLQLPGLPEVTLKALDACEQGSSYRQLSDLIGMDTALVSRILALANSALYGQPGAIRSLEQALTRLGPQRIYALILTSGLGQLPVEPSQDQWQQLRDFWRHSLTTALTARTLATLTRYPTPDEAFLLGILHNIGELIALAMPEGDARQQVLNDQAELGARLVTDWGLGALAGMPCATSRRHRTTLSMVATWQNWSTSPAGWPSGMRLVSLPPARSSGWRKS